MEFETVNCKCCGAVLDLTKMVGQVVRCDYCGGSHVLARSDRAKNFLDQGEHDLDTCRFEEALSAYEKAAEIDEKEPEAWFGMAAARFKIQFLKDEVNNRLQPICHDPSDKSFYDDECFRKALTLSTEEQKREYKKRGREIDEINEEFYALKKSGLTYDCFICAKVTEEDGRTRTADYERANDVYYFLKDEGYKPFFSEREMKGRTGSDYEALILYALSVSECMLIVCSDERYLQTKWLKNEYSRFMAMIDGDEKARDALTFVFNGKPVEKLPNGKKIQGIDGSRPDAYARIAGFVKNHTAVARAAAEAERLQKQQREQARSREIEELRNQFAEIQKQQGTGQNNGQGNDELTRELRLAREAKEREEQAKREKEQKYLAQFVIEDGVLKKYKGKNKNVRIPEGVTAIGDHAFENCNFLENVTIPEGVTAIGEGAFQNCEYLSSIDIPDSVTLIGNRAFANSPMYDGYINLKFSENMLSIGDEAFLNCGGLTRVEIPDTVKSIGKNVFSGCTLIDIISIPASQISQFSDSHLKKVVITSGESIVAHAFKGQNLIESITIPDSVKSIGEGAFEDCSSLKSIVIPNGVKSIGNSMFEGCMRLESIQLPNSVTMIGDGAFESCSALKSIVIPAGVKSIGKNAFRYTALTKIKIPNGVTSIGENAFAQCSSLTSVVIPGSMKSIGKNAFHLSGLTSIVVPHGVTSIGESAFSDCESLVSAVIPESVNSLVWTFWGCKALQTVTMPKRFKGFMGKNLPHIFVGEQEHIQFTFTK